MAQTLARLARWPARVSGVAEAVENDDYARFAARIIQAHGRQIAESDVDVVADLLPAPAVRHRNRKKPSTAS